MKKLPLLKTIVDFIWVMSIICYPLILLFTIMTLLSKDLIDIPITFTGTTVDLTGVYGKIALLVTVLNFGLLLYGLYFFRKLLDHFRKRLLFETVICTLLNKIGNILLLSAVLYLIADFIGGLPVSHVGIQFGYGPFLYILALGLFFKVLSEVFQTAQNLKEENELTI